MAALTLEQFYQQNGLSQKSSNPQAVSTALGLYNRQLAQAWLGNAWAALSRRTNRLVDLEALKASRSVRSSHYAGLRSVPIDRIRGSQGRSEDFDARFRPRQERTRDRWLSVASAVQRGLGLPPVELIQVGDAYFVKDGHHRISVAKAMGQRDVDAEVTVLEIN